MLYRSVTCDSFVGFSSSWTTITDAAGFVEERLSFDAWGNLRDASTWTSVPSRLPRFDRGFTGHEHLYSFGLINMNGRMYDPLLSSFLSPDNYMQDPTSQQGFNRYAYCMYNPLKYVDPTGEQYFGWDPGMMNRIEQEAKRIVRQCWQVVYDDISMSHAMTVALANSLYSQGDNRMGKGGSGNHGSGGGGNGDGRYSEEYLRKCEELGITPGKPIPKEKQTNDFLKDFQEKFYPNAPMDDIYNFKVAGINKDDIFNKYPFGIGGRTRPEQVDGILTGCSNVYFNDDYVYNSPEHLYYTMGHELIHVSQIASLAGESYSLFLDNDFVSVIEFNASLWEHCWGNYKQLHFVPTDHALERYNYLYYEINYIYFDWTHSLIHPY
jgi:RHS repeat-associated protein